MLGWISRINQRLPPSSYEDPHGDMPVDDEDMPPPQAQQPEPDLDDDPIELTLVVILHRSLPEAALRCRSASTRRKVVLPNWKSSK